VISARCIITTPARAAERQPGVRGPGLSVCRPLRRIAYRPPERAEHRGREHQQQARRGRARRSRLTCTVSDPSGVSGASQPSNSASSMRSEFTATYSFECFTSTRSPTNVRAVEHAVHHHGDALLEDAARLAVVAHRLGDAVEEMVNTVVLATRSTVALVDGALQAEAAILVAPRAHRPRRRCSSSRPPSEELGDDHAAGDHHEASTSIGSQLRRLRTACRRDRGTGGDPWAWS
jgi:hypothetical protein